MSNLTSSLWYANPNTNALMGQHGSSIGPGVPSLTPEQEAKLSAVHEALNTLDAHLEGFRVQLKSIRACLVLQGLLPSSGSLLDIPEVRREIDAERYNHQILVDELKRLVERPQPYPPPGQQPHFQYVDARGRVRSGP